MASSTRRARRSRRRARSSRSDAVRSASEAVWSSPGLPCRGLRSLVEACKGQIVRPAPQDLRPARQPSCPVRSRAAVSTADHAAYLDCLAGWPSALRQGTATMPPRNGRVMKVRHPRKGRAAPFARPGGMTGRHDTVPTGVPTADTAFGRRVSPAVAPSPASPDAKARENAMAIDQVDRTVVTTQEPTATGQATVQTDSRRTTTSGPGGAELARRIVVLVFGLIQIVIGARIVLLLLDAREANALVSAVLDISQVFVAPFEGILRDGLPQLRGLRPRYHRHRGPRRLDHPRADRALGHRDLPAPVGRSHRLTAVAVPARGRVNLRPLRDPSRAGATRKEQLPWESSPGSSSAPSPGSSPTSSWAEATASS